MSRQIGRKHEMTPTSLDPWYRRW